MNPIDTVCQSKWDWPIYKLSVKEFKMCCLTPLVKASENDIDLLNTDYQKRRRLEMLQGIQHKDCNICWKAERAGSKSDRNYVSEIPFTEQFKDELLSEFGTTDLVEVAKVVNINSKILTSTKPTRLEISVSSTCDLQCVYCYNKNSTQWAVSDYKNKIISLTEYKELSATDCSTPFAENMWNWIDTQGKHTLEWISILGGEPTISQEFYDSMDRLIDIFSTVPDRKPELYIITNLNTPPEFFEKFLEYLLKLSKMFKLVVGISIDDINERGAFIRHNLDWDRFSKNINQLLSMQYMEHMDYTKPGDFSKYIKFHSVKLYPAISVLSISNIYNFLLWRNELSEKYDRHLILAKNIVSYPAFLSPNLVPENHKYIKQAIDLIKTDKRYRGDQWFISFLLDIENQMIKSPECGTDLMVSFYNRVNLLDKKQKFKEIFPELADFYNKCKSAAGH